MCRASLQTAVLVTCSTDLRLNYLSEGFATWSEQFGQKLEIDTFVRHDEKGN